MCRILTSATPREGTSHPMTASIPQLALPTYRERLGLRESVRPLVPSALVTLVAVLVYGWQAGRPGLWRDEAATITACRRSLPEVFHLTQHVDLVHLAYYLLAKGVWQIDGTVTAVRWISVIGMALSA